MLCPVCNDYHITRAEELVSVARKRFAPCSLCPLPLERVLSKRDPLPSSYTVLKPCACNKRFIDDVIAHIYFLFVEQGVFSGDEALADVGIPMPDPGFFSRQPPYLSSHSLLLLTPHSTAELSHRLVREVPELHGVVSSNNKVPGISASPDYRALEKINTHTYTLSAGCDVRADIFPCSGGSCVIYKQQSCMHIEFPRGYYPKIRSVERYLKRVKPHYFIDACSGSGTLGITAAMNGVPHVVLNDAWYAGAFFSGFNLLVNQESLKYDEVIMHTDYQSMQNTPVRSEPVLIAEAYGDKRSCHVYHGDLWHLGDVLDYTPDLTVIDPFDKKDTGVIDTICSQWRRQYGGEVFVP